MQKVEDKKLTLISKRKLEFIEERFVRKIITTNGGCKLEISCYVP